MNKLLFIFERDFNEDIVLIAYNHKDLEDYLNNNYDWFEIEVSETNVIIREREGYLTEVVTLNWAKHI